VDQLIVLENLRFFFFSLFQVAPFIGSNSFRGTFAFFPPPKPFRFPSTSFVRSLLTGLDPPTQSSSKPPRDLHFAPKACFFSTPYNPRTPYRKPRQHQKFYHFFVPSSFPIPPFTTFFAVTLSLFAFAASYHLFFFLGPPNFLSFFFSQVFPVQARFFLKHRPFLQPGFFFYHNFPFLCLRFVLPIAPKFFTQLPFPPPLSPLSVTACEMFMQR